MKMVKVDEVKAKMLEIMRDLQKKYPDREVTLETIETKDGLCVQFIFEIKSVMKELRKTGCRIKTAAYIFETKKRVSTFIVNGINMRLVFHNHTINAPEITVHYLNDTLLHGIKWLEEKEKEVEVNKEKHRQIREAAGNTSKKPKKPSGKNPVPKAKKPNNNGNKGNGGNNWKKPYNKNGQKKTGGNNGKKPFDYKKKGNTGNNKNGKR